MRRARPLVYVAAAALLRTMDENPDVTWSLVTGDGHSHRVQPSRLS